MKNLFRSISKKEWRFVGLMIMLAIVATSVPYLYGYFTTPRGMVYTGVHKLTPGDLNVQLSMIEQVKQGENVFLNLYTAEPQHRIFINPYWLTVGWLAKIFNLPGLLALHLARVIGIAVFVAVLYLFITYFASEQRKRKWLLAIVLFSSGLGVFFGPLVFNPSHPYEQPVDHWVPESNTFLTMYNLPHQLASLTLIVIIFLLMLLAFETNKARFSVSAGLAGLLMFWFHPFNGPTIYGVLATYLLIIFLTKRKIIWHYLKHFFILAAVPLPAVIYLFLISQADWVISQWNKQNILPSPSVRMYLFGYGLLLPLALLGLWITFKKNENKGIFLVCWLVCSSLLVYFPIYFQRRMSEGLQLPMAMLAGAALFYLYEKLNYKDNPYSIKRNALVMFFLIFLPLTNIEMVGQDVFNYQTKKEFYYYIYREDVAAMQWLKKNLSQRDIVFCSFFMGNFIPAYSGRIVWIGHGPQTINLPEKKLISAWFWQNDNESEEKYDLLKRDGADYLFYGEKEKELGSFNPATKYFLRQVYQNSRVQIYKIL